MSTVATLEIGDIVLALVPEREVADRNNGADVAPAVVTRVWGAAYGDGTAICANYRIVHDEEGADTWVTSANVYADESSARAARAAGLEHWVKAGGDPAAYSRGIAWIKQRRSGE